MCNSVPVLCAPDGVSVVGPIVVGVDVVGASVGAAAAHPIRILFAAAPALVGPCGEVSDEDPRVPEYVARPQRASHEPLGERPTVPRTVPLEYPYSIRRVPGECPKNNPIGPFNPLRTPLKYPLSTPSLP